MIKKEINITGVILLVFSMLSVQPLKAQTVNMTADVNVLNTLTLNSTSQLNYGVVAAARDLILQAIFSLATDGTYTTTSLGSATIASVDNALVAPGVIEISDGAGGALLNITIDNVVNPVNGGEFFILNNFFTSYNGGPDILRLASVPFVEIYNAGFNGGVNTLEIGMSLLTSTGTGSYGDGVYTGSYDVILSY